VTGEVQISPYGDAVSCRSWFDSGHVHHTSQEITMIAQLQAQRIIDTVSQAGSYRLYLNLSQSPTTTLPAIASARANLARKKPGNSTEERLIDLLDQALHIRAKALRAALPKPRFSLEAVARLVGA
jgi:hypothetical protein